MYLLPLEPPSHLPPYHILPHQAVTEKQGELPVAHSISHLLSVLHMVMCMFLYCSLNPPHPLLPRCVHKSVLYVCVSTAALQIGPSVTSYQIPYAYLTIQHLPFSFSPAALCLKGSRFIYLIRSNVYQYYFNTNSILNHMKLMQYLLITFIQPHFRLYYYQHFQIISISRNMFSKYF